MSYGHKIVDVKWGGLDGDSGDVELYAGVFGNVDRGGDVLQPGAFKNLDEFVKSGWLAVNHDKSALPVATIDSATQDSRGLRIRAHFHSTPQAQAVRTVVKERLARGKAVPASFGYRTISSEPAIVDGRTVRSLKAVHIHEASIVSLPMNPAAGVVGAKYHADQATRAYLEFVGIQAKNLTRQLRAEYGRPAAARKPAVDPREELLEALRARRVASQSEISGLKREFDATRLRLAMAGLRYGR